MEGQGLLKNGTASCLERDFRASNVGSAGSIWKGEPIGVDSSLGRGWDFDR